MLVSCVCTYVSYVLVCTYCELKNYKRIINKQHGRATHYKGKKKTKRQLEDTSKKEKSVHEN